MRRKTIVKNIYQRCPKQPTYYKIESTEELLHLIEIYLTEWIHRDSLLWKQIFTYFFATLVVMILPFANIWDIDFGAAVPQWIFPITGIILAIIFLIIGNGYAARLKAIGDTYNNLIDMLPSKYRRIKINSLNHNNITNVRLSYFIVYIMFILLLMLGGIILYIIII